MFFNFSNRIKIINEPEENWIVLILSKQGASLRQFANHQTRSEVTSWATVFDSWWDESITLF